MGCRLRRWFIDLGVIVGTMSTCFAQTKGYGDPSDTYPSYPTWLERGILTATNACRMDPRGFRDKYVGNYQILLDANGYHVVAPLYYHVNLNRSARAYAVDMATNCGWLSNHNSCNGDSFTTRLRSYYTSYPIGENKATGNAGALETIVQWIKEATTGTPVADGSGDGHRANLMNRDFNFRECSAGYGYSSTKQYNHFWVQDFGGATPVVRYPIPSASHHFNSQKTTITFWANFYDSANTAPQEVALFLDGQKYAMTLDVGTAARGNYIYATTAGSVCRSYYVTARDNAGRTWRYPFGGTLRTNGEGACTEEYLPPSSGVIIVIHHSTSSSGVSIKMAGSSFLSMAFADKNIVLVKTSIYDVQGHFCAEKKWGRISTDRIVFIDIDRVAGRGVLFVINECTNGLQLVNRVVLR